MKAFVAIPALDELDFLPRTLQCLQHQSRSDFEVHICVNQPDGWWKDGEKRVICERNQKLIAFLLRQNYSFPLFLIDKSSPGCGWNDKDYGVGWARKTLFESILTKANDDDILISMDADTTFGEHYVASLMTTFDAHPQWPAVAVPYYHKLTGNEVADRAILRYEIYMRNCFLNLCRIGSPYNFTAIGSAIALKIKTIKKINGITPLKSGEDFYLLQKIRKMAPVGLWNSEMVFPAARFSERVSFGTGPALIKGSRGLWDSYPIYHFSLFDEIKSNYELIDKLYQEDINTKFIAFLKSQFKTDDLWAPLRKNSKDLPHFRQAFHEKADALRILQFCKLEQPKLSLTDEQSLRENYPLLTNDPMPEYLKNDFSFEKLSLDQLQEIREKLFEEENTFRQRVTG